MRYSFKGLDSVTTKAFLTVITVHESRRETSLLTKTEFDTDNSFVPYNIINDIPFIDEDDVDPVFMK